MRYPIAFLVAFVVSCLVACAPFSTAVGGAGGDVEQDSGPAGECDGEPRNAPCDYEGPAGLCDGHGECGPQQSYPCGGGLGADGCPENMVLYCARTTASPPPYETGCQDNVPRGGLPTFCCLFIAADAD